MMHGRKNIKLLNIYVVVGVEDKISQWEKQTNLFILQGDKSDKKLWHTQIQEIK